MRWPGSGLAPVSGRRYGRTKMASMTRTVGTQARSEIILDPQEAWRRGRSLDQMLAAARIPYPQGVRRARHGDFNQIDDQRQVEQARRLNVSPVLPTTPGGPAR